MKILIACEFSGKLRDFFRAKGHDTLSCDILPSLAPGPHYKGDVLDILDEEWDMMIGFPPCTYLCSGSHPNKNKIPNYREHQESAYAFFLRLYHAKIERICLENPIGHINSHFRKPDQVIHPYMFGHRVRKDTCLWLKGLPLLKPTRIMPPPYKKWDFWSSIRNPCGYSRKSIIFNGIARAMANQWGSHSLLES